MNQDPRTTKLIGVFWRILMFAVSQFEREFGFSREKARER